jgi:copper chaperone CopZ
MSINGVFSVQADPTAHYAYVTYDGAMTSLEEMQRVLFERGYPVKGYEYLRSN